MINKWESKYVFDLYFFRFSRLKNAFNVNSSNTFFDYPLIEKKRRILPKFQVLLRPSQLTTILHNPEYCTEL